MQLMTLSNGSLIIGLAVISEVLHGHQHLKTLYIMIRSGLIASCFCSINFVLLKPTFELCSFTNYLTHQVSFMGEGDRWILNSTLIGFILRIFEWALAWLALYC